MKALGYSVDKMDTMDQNWQRNDFEFAVIMLHGAGGEDGSIQAYLDQVGIPYLGSDASSSALAMNKVYSKYIFDRNGIPTAPYQINISSKHSLSYPVVVKPIASGSSVGVEIIDTPERLAKWQTAHQHELSSYFMETYIPGREVTVSIIEVKNEIQILPILELKPKTKFYDYHAKYTAGMTEFLCPADLGPDLLKQVEETALSAYRSIGCRHFSRVDIRIDPQESLFVLEVNTLPGFTNLSDLPAQAKAAGYSFNELVKLLLDQIVLD